MNRLRLTLALLCLSITVHAAKVPDTAWQTGTLRDMQSTTGSRVYGVMNDGHGVLGQSSYLVMHYVIEGPGYVYQANLLLRGRHPKQLLVTVHGPIQFAMVGHDFYIKDDEGKPQKLIFVGRALRQ